MLMLAGLARFETILFGGPILLLLAGGVRTRWWHPAWRMPKGAGWLLLVLGALPLQALHDWALTGDPLWTESVPAIASAAPVAAPVAVIKMIVAHYTTMALLVALAVPAAVGLIARSRWAILAGLAVLGPGILAFLVFLSFRHIYISSRYLYPTDIALVFSAALGLAELRLAPTVLATIGRWTDWVEGRGAIPGRLRSVGLAALPIAFGGVVALGAVQPFAPLGHSLTLKIQDNHDLFVNELAALPAMRAAIAQIPGAKAMPANPSPRARGDVRTTYVLAPVLLVPRLAVDLGVPVTAVAGIDPAKLGTDGYLHPGLLVYHDERNDVPVTDYTLIEVDHATTIGSVRLVPLIADPVRRFWLIRVETAR